ncbi:MAG: hypothetical protein A2W98_07535 [Bacteroidetes bacterium GWF2_33_38]|nr:MAG: hypothetical protein A2W98_07535 [Bacteroidetes bacterium GWF2_33_38]OFY92290.1 MAG: hypothetical protein A2236_06780 [Bacteroidetes bacterium RIFOXYA2_FULL_33_7]
MFFSQDLFSQDCNITSKANDILPDKLCAPVSLTWEVTYRGVNDGGTLVQVQFDWDDGNAVELVNAINTNPNPLIREWQVTVSHVYPQNGINCNYNPNATLVVNGIICSSSIQEQSVTVWDTDDENGGIVAIDPIIFPICAGNSGTVTFQDVSTFNCVPPIENDVPNISTRWTQWIYGTNYDITNVEVDGTVQVYPFAGDVEEHTGPVTGPTPPNDFSLPCFAPSTATVGQFFEVTLNYWNYCNPYPDSLPVTTTAMILIVDYPDATITPVGPFCSNASSILLTAATAGGTWSGTGITNSATGNFNPSVAGAGNHLITYTVSNAYGCAGVDTILIKVWARPQINILPSTNAEVCPGDTLFIDGNPTEGSGNIISHLWTGSTSNLNQTTIQNPYFLTSTQGTYNLTYTVVDENACSRSQNMTISVNPVSANILPDPAEICAGENLILDGNPSGGTGIYSFHNWNGDTTYISQTNIETPIFNSSTIGTYNLTYIVSDSNGCTGSDNTSVTVFENPIANAGIGDSICGNSYNLHAVPSIGTGTWTKISGLGNVNFSNLNDSLATVTVDNYGSYVFQWKEVSGALCSDSSQITIVFVEIPNSDAGANDTICGLNYQMNANSSVGQGTWTQKSGAGTAIFQTPNIPSSNVSVDVFGSYVFQWKEINNFNCSDSGEVIINFDLVPTPSFTPTSFDDCSGFSITYTNTSLGASNYFWDFGDGNNSTDETPSHTFLNENDSDTTYTIKLITESVFGCIDSVAHSVTVHPIPKSSYDFDITPACSPLTLNFIENSLGADMLIWNYNDGSQLDTTNNPTHTFINDTSFIQFYEVNLIAISEYNCKDTTEAWVTVFPNAIYDFTLIPSSACNPENVNFSAVQGAFMYTWDFGDGIIITDDYNINHTYSNLLTVDTTYNIKLKTTSFFGCSDSVTHNIVVHPKPNAEFSLDTTSACTPFIAEITNLSTGADFYYWDYGDGNLDTISLNQFSHQFLNQISTPISNTITLISKTQFECKDTFSITVTTYPEIISEFSCDSVGCSPLTIQFTNQSIGAISYNWDFGNNSTSSIKNPTNQYIISQLTDTNFVVHLIATSQYSCTDSVSKEITVNPKPIANFTLSDSIFCAPKTIDFINLSIGGNSYEWYFGDNNFSTSSDSIISHEYNNNQSVPNYFDVSFIVSNIFNCTDEIQKQIVVYPSINADFLTDSIGCSPLSISLLNTSVGTQDYEWIFGDGISSSITNPTHIFTNLSTINDTVFTLKLTANSMYNCKDSISKNINVLAVPIAKFVMDNILGCSPLSINFENTSSSCDLFKWNFGDGDTISTQQSSLNHIFENTISVPNNYIVELTAQNVNGCTDATSQTVLVYPEIIANFYYDSVGCSPLQSSFINQSFGANIYTWNFSNQVTSTQTNPTHIFTNNSGTDSIFEVQLIAESQYHCLDSIRKNITVYASPTANFTALPTSQIYPFSSITIDNLTNLGNWNFDWNFGDGDFSTQEHPLMHQYDNFGNYTIMLTVSGTHCSDTSFRQIEIIPALPIADFDSSAQGCEPLTVQFSNKSQNATNYEWNFGDGNTSSQENPAHTFIEAGTYEVSLKAIGPGGSDETTNATINVFPNPIAEFTISPIKVYLPNQQINCYNLSENATAYMWYFGNGDSTSVENPKYVYTEVGIYTITLKAWSDSNCVDTEIKPEAVETTVGGNINYPNAFTPNADGEPDGKYNKYDYSNDIFFPIAEGVEQYHFEVYNRWGELLFVSEDINIGWNGYYRGEICKQDVYVWKVTGKLSNGESFFKSGDVTLLR